MFVRSPIKSLSIVTVFLPALVLSSVWPSSAQPSPRPFWTEQSAYIEGEDLFAVGVASHVRTLEEGRKLAFENGKVEILNYSQISSLDIKGLVIETQMTYEEKNADGSYNVFRLLKVPRSALQAKQEERPPPPSAPEQPSPSSPSRNWAGPALVGAVVGGLIGGAVTFVSPVGMAVGAAIGAGLTTSLAMQ